MMTPTCEEVRKCESREGDRLKKTIMKERLHYVIYKHNELYKSGIICYTGETREKKRSTTNDLGEKGKYVQNISPVLGRRFWVGRFVRTLWRMGEGAHHRLHLNRIINNRERILYAACVRRPEVRRCRKAILRETKAL